jgi:hypothetical protein
MEVKICRNIGLSLPQPILIIERNGGLTLFLIHISVLAPKSKAPIKNKARSAFWMTNSIGDRASAALRYTKQRKPIRSGRHSRSLT